MPKSDVPGGNVNGKLWQFDLMPGYQVMRGSATFGGYVGLDYQDSQLTPNDPANKLSGTKAGVKVAGSFDFEDGKRPIAASLAAEYSTAFDTYFAELRVGARVCKNLFIGPGGSLDGDTGYNAQRLGGFAKYTFALTKDVPLKLTLVARTPIRQRLQR
jgi:Cellulose biosynthesis protein BcsS